MSDRLFERELPDAIPDVIAIQPEERGGLR